jgi:hypothetical protein
MPMGIMLGEIERNKKDFDKELYKNNRILKIVKLKISVIKIY